MATLPVMLVATPRGLWYVFMSLWSSDRPVLYTWQAMMRQTVEIWSDKQ